MHVCLNVSQLTSVPCLGFSLPLELCHFCLSVCLSVPVSVSFCRPVCRSVGLSVGPSSFPPASLSVCVRLCPSSWLRLSVYLVGCLRDCSVDTFSLCCSYVFWVFVYVFVLRLLVSSLRYFLSVLIPFTPSSPTTCCAFLCMPVCRWADCRSVRLSVCLSDSLCLCTYVRM